MTIEAITGLIGVLAWPVVVLISILLLRREVTALFGRVREIEGPGDLKLTLDPNKVEQIIKEGRDVNALPSTVAERIVQSVTVMNKLEARILRALFDDDGRAIYNYQSDYYRQALESLLAKNYIRKVGKGFGLTKDGQRVTKEYLLGALQGIEASESSSEQGTKED